MIQNMSVNHNGWAWTLNWGCNLNFTYPCASKNQQHSEKSMYLLVVYWWFGWGKSTQYIEVLIGINTECIFCDINFLNLKSITYRISSNKRPSLINAPHLQIFPNQIINKPPINTYFSHYFVSFQWFFGAGWNWDYDLNLVNIRYTVYLAGATI